jgi:hypothetical protein
MSTGLIESVVDGDGALASEPQRFSGEDGVARLLLQHRAGRVATLTRAERRNLQPAGGDSADVWSASCRQTCGCRTRPSWLQPDE